MKAKVKLLLDFPFFSTIALNLKYVEDPTIETMATNGVQIKWNPAFVDKMTLEETTGVIAHEVCHCIFLHMTRRQGRIGTKFNVACDFAINPIILDAKLKLPAGHLYDAQYRDKSAEEIYRLLPDSTEEIHKLLPPQCYLAGDDLGVCGMVEDAPGKTEAEIAKVESEIKQLVAKSLIVAKQAGKLPAGLERLIEEALQPKINWREVLNRFLTQVVQSDYSWRKPNKRYIGSDLYLPAMESIESGDFVLAVDTSGSIGMRELSQFAAEMREIAEAFKCGFKIIWCDAAVAGVQDIEPDEDMELKPAGFGGTDFRPPFEYVEANDINLSAFVYFTDGYCDSFPEEPGYPVLWAVMDNKSFTPPFGETLHMQSGEEF